MTLVTTLQDVEVITADVDLDSVVSFRASISSIQEQASCVAPIPTVTVDFSLCAHAQAGATRGPTTISLPITAKRCACILPARFWSARADSVAGEKWAEGGPLD